MNDEMDGFMFLLKNNPVVLILFSAFFIGIMLSVFYLRVKASRKIP